MVSMMPHIPRRDEQLLADAFASAVSLLGNSERFGAKETCAGRKYMFVPIASLTDTKSEYVLEEKCSRLTRAISVRR